MVLLHPPHPPPPPHPAACPSPAAITVHGQGEAVITAAHGAGANYRAAGSAPWEEARRRWRWRESSRRASAWGHGPDRASRGYLVATGSSPWRWPRHGWVGDGMRWRMGCHPRGSCWVRDHFLKLHPGSASRSFSPAPAIFLMDLMELITAGRLMQRRPHGHSAAGHSSGVNHAAPTRHHCLSIVWGRAAPLCSASLSPLCVGTQLAITGEP